jgi:uncharacterized protein
VLGILAGAALYSEVYPFFRDHVLTLGAWGKLTLPAVLCVNHWLVIVPLVLLGGAALLWLDRRTGARA